LSNSSEKPFRASIGNRGDHECSREEAHIFQSWKLNLKDSGISQPPKGHFSSPSLWSPPPDGFIKINFDGASKGNPGPAGYGAVIRNSTGEILLLTAGYLGETTNNVAELTGLLQGLQKALGHTSHNIILEGDSQIVIQLITKILHGGQPHKISPSWRLAGLLEDFQSLLRRNINVIPSHIKRKANTVADLLANEGVIRERENITWSTSSPEPSDLYHRCKLLASKDHPTPDGVTRVQEGERRGKGRWRGEAGGLYLPSSPHTPRFIMSVTLCHLRSMELLSTSARDRSVSALSSGALMAFMVYLGSSTSRELHYARPAFCAE
jgi:ribonuclease HI